jgi:hypothetical protein
MALSLPLSKDLRKLLAFGHGVGVEVGSHDLEIAVTRVRPSGVQVIGRLTIGRFQERPAAEWGAEYASFLKKLSVSHLAATVLLPRQQVIVRQIALPGVSGSDLEGAIRFQIDALHPYGDDEVAWGWSALDGGAVLIGIVRRATLDSYVQLFVEAGIAVASFTFSAAAVHAAIRLNGAPAEHAASGGFLALSAAASGGVEVYGESAARPVFSAQFDLPPERAAMLAASELRLAPDTAALNLEDVLPKPQINPIENDLSRNALPYATALAGACPRLAPAANLLPPEYRKATSRAMFIPSAVLAAALILSALAMLVYSRYADRQYLKNLDAEIGRLEPLARRAAALDREIDRVRGRSRLLDEFRGRTRADLDALNELTKLVEPPAWTSSIDLMRDSARISGEAPQASSMLKIIDSSPLFENSEFSMITRSGSSELFQIRTNREARK